MFLTPERSTGVAGLGALVKLKKGVAPADLVLEAEAALCAGLGVGGGTPASRVGQYEALRKAFAGVESLRSRALTMTLVSKT